MIWGGFLLCVPFPRFIGSILGSGVGSGGFWKSRIYNPLSLTLNTASNMNAETAYPVNENGYYLRVFPWSSIPESVVNAIRTDVSTFSAPGVWYGFDTYFWKRNWKAFSVQIINSNKKEWLSHYVRFLSKLYAWRISFSAVPIRFPEAFEHNRSVWSAKRSKVFRTKGAGSVAGDDFEGSSSFVSSLVSEWLPHFEKENGIAKISFSFTEAEGWYSRLIEAILIARRKNGMSPEEKAAFEEAERKKPIHRFLYRWKISASWVSNSFPRVIRQIIRWYWNERNSYALANERARHYPGRRLIDGERLLSHGLVAMRANPHRKVRKIPILPIPVSAFDDGFVIYQ